MRTAIAILLLCVPVFAQHDHAPIGERIDALDASPELKSILRELTENTCYCGDAERPECPATVTMHNGEVLYVTGHEYTVYATKPGALRDPEIWSTGKVPGPNDKVFLPAGRTVSLLGEFSCRTLVCAGTLKVENAAVLRCSTITGLPGAKLVAGKEDNPIGFRWDCRTVPFEDDDTGQFGNGLVWCGHDAVTIWGKAATVWEHVDGEYKVFPDRCSVQFVHAGGDIRPHMMFMHGSSTLRGVFTRGFGRSDKSKVLSPDNPIGRYAFHAHRGGPDHVSHWTDCVAIDSLGWGLVNHASNVIRIGCATEHCYGAGIVGEAGDEVGRDERCLSKDCYSTEPLFTSEKFHAGQPWYHGTGFAYTGDSIQVVDCVASGCTDGFFWFSVTPHREPAAHSGLTVDGWRRSGLWIARRGKEHGTLFKDIAILNGGKNAVMIEYDRGLTIDGLMIDQCETAITFRNEPAKFDMKFRNFAITNCDVGLSSHYHSSCPMSFESGTLQANKIGLRCVPGVHVNARKIVRAVDVEITAPVPVDLVDPGEPYDAYLVNVNEVWVNGEQFKFPWQE